MTNRLAMPIALLMVLIAIIGCGPPRYKDVAIQVDGERRALRTTATTVRDVLNEADIAVGELDRVQPDLWAEVTPGMTIVVTRVEEKIEVVRQSIPFAHRTIKSEAMALGETRLIQLGVNGEEEITYRVTLEDGVETQRRAVRRVTITEAVDEIVVVGTRGSLAAVPISGTIAYIASGNAWVMRDTSGGRRPLTAEGDLDGWVFDLSPDGRRLLFTRRTGSGPSAPLNTLWIASTTVVGEPPQPLGLEGAIYGQWVADGQGFVYSTAERVGGSPGWKAHNDLWLVTLSADEALSPTLPSTATVQLSATPDVTATVSPEPTVGPTTAITIVSISQVITPTNDRVYGWWGTNFALSPKGGQVAYAEADRIGLIDAANQRWTTLLEFPVFRTYSEWVWVPSLSWSPDGQFVASTVHAPSETGEDAEDSPIFDVWILSADGRIKVPLVGEAGMWARPLWSPRGNRIAYGLARNPRNSQDSRYDLYVMERDGSNKRKLFPPDDRPGLIAPQLTWSPAGDQLAVVYDGNLYLLDVTDGRSYQLTGDGQSAQPRWSR